MVSKPTICFFRALMTVLILLNFTSAVEDTNPTPAPSLTSLEIAPEGPGRVFEGDYLLINLTYNGTTSEGAESVFLIPELLVDYHTERLRMTSNQTMEFKFINGYWQCQNNCSIEVYGVFVGEAIFKFLGCSGSLCSKKENFLPILDEYHVYISRKPRALDTIFTVVLVCFSCVVNLGMGCKIDTDVVKKTLKKPIAPAVGFFCQFLFMPVFAFGLTQVLGLSSTESVGLFANGCSPGGGPSNMWTLLFGGDVSLSITMTTVSTFSALGMFPLWMYTLGRVIVSARFRIAFENIIISLVAIVIPSIIGILVKRFRPKFAALIDKVLKPIMLLLLIFMFTVGIWINFFMFRLFTPRLIAAGACLPSFGFLTGCLISFLARRKKAHIIAITLETGIQNVNVAVMTLRLSLPQPQNDLSMIAALVPSLFTGLPLLVVYAGYAMFTRCRNRNSGKLEFDNQGSTAANDVEKEEAPAKEERCETPATTKSTDNLATPHTTNHI